MPIIGVVEDFNFESLHESIKPCFITVAPMWRSRYISVKLKSDNITGAVKGIQKKWDSFVDNRPFEYYFVDQYFDSLYKQEVLFKKDIYNIFHLIYIYCQYWIIRNSFTTYQKKNQRNWYKKNFGCVASDSV